MYNVSARIFLLTWSYLPVPPDICLHMQLIHRLLSPDLPWYICCPVLLRTASLLHSSPVPELYLMYMRWIFLQFYSLSLSRWNTASAPVNFPVYFHSLPLSEPQVYTDISPAYFPEFLPDNDPIRMAATIRRIITDWQTGFLQTAPYNYWYSGK